MPMKTDSPVVAEKDACRVRFFFTELIWDKMEFFTLSLLFPFRYELDISELLMGWSIKTFVPTLKANLW